MCTLPCVVLLETYTVYISDNRLQACALYKILYKRRPAWHIRHTHLQQVKASRAQVKVQLEQRKFSKILLRIQRTANSEFSNLIKICMLSNLFKFYMLI